ncbi:MAG: hypothetical protein AB7I27_02295 [Bacteriovoracaceae bacterium]
MKKKMRKLNSHELTTLKKHFTPTIFSFGQDLVYEKQVPNTGFVLVKGQMNLTKRKKAQEQIEPGSLLGVHEMVNNEPAQMGCKVEPNSEVIIISKSEVTDAIKNNHHELKKIIVPD